MDWNLAIERNTTTLKRVAAMLCAMAGLAGLTSPLAGEDGSARRGKAGSPAEPGEGCVSPPLVLPRHLHRAILRLLRPAESAVRRLIIVLARGLVVTLAPPRGTKPAAAASQDGIAIPRPGHAPASPSPLWGGVRGGGTLPLLDPLKRSVSPLRPAAIPRISLPGVTQPFPLAPRNPPAPDDPLDATRLALRLQAVVTALDDLPAQARRFARWRAFRTQEKDTAAAPARKNRRAWPLRPGRPPGQRPKRLRGHAVHDILSDLHGLAFDALERPDTS
ncbi:hypothetical protein ABUE31_16215 [Mesorhizobium sp. ZMM04-5]|uniref:Uncharacterized protein n=1 Tax=Mesorhizobium marinum TaxID=3228790 RepID=A0ABV3R3D4_9HYPH